MASRWSVAVRVCSAVFVCAALAVPAAAKTLRFASAFDPNSLDPHSLALLYQTRVVTQVYESLVNRDRDYRIEPALATSWKTVEPTTWRFTLRRNVKFHDGTPFTADDVVFSIERALVKTSQRAAQLRGVTGARKVDALTVDILLEAPDAVLPDKLYLVFIMSRAWSEKNGVLQPQDYNAKQETFAVRNAMGTGAFMLKSYEPDRRLVLVSNPNWWGRSEPATAAQLGNVTEAIYTVIQQDATRLAALASGEVDFVIDAPFQDAARLKRDAALKVNETTDLGTQYLGFDQARDELAYSDVKGRNPFKDLRVRRAVAHAIDVDTIVAKVLRGQAKPTGSFISPLVDGHVPALEQRRPHDPARARALLKEAGYPDGFAVTLDCVNVTYRTAVCQAMAAMLAQVGIRVSFQPSPSALFFPKLTQATASFFEFGWTPATDVWSTLNSIVRTWDGKGAGQFNGGRYSNARLDATIDAIRVEPELGKRRTLIADALRMMNDDLPLIPLYRRTLTWVMRPNIDVVQWPSDVLELRWVRIREPSRTP
ncbi:MAG TPA: ABC transporter substrate-binding protein [Burkholderiaceae bacterium]|nr:ABC transporter substrate-binding protein [Burkholderiaceae bacterium]